MSVRQTFVTIADCVDFSEKLNLLREVLDKPYGVVSHREQTVCGALTFSLVARPKSRTVSIDIMPRCDKEASVRLRYGGTWWRLWTDREDRTVTVPNADMSDTVECMLRNARDV